MKNILFVCTGNVFRSMTADFALRRHLGDHAAVTVSSAGIEDSPGLRVRDDVARYLLLKGLDVSSHRRKVVCPDLIAGANLVVAMSTNHRDFLRHQFSVTAPLFMEACGMGPEALPDVDDLFPPSDWHGAEAQRHIRATIDRIIDMVPRLARNLAR